MQQIVQQPRGGGVSLVEVPAPAVRPGHLLVQVGASLISAGTERMVTGFAEKSLIGKARARPDLVRQVHAKFQRDGLAATWAAVTARLADPLPLGYSAAGTVIAVGAGLEGRFHAGERVAIAGAGFANHAELDLVPGNLAVPLPADLPPEQACFATVGAIALHAVRLAEPRLGEWVAVIGTGLVGLLAVQFALASGANVLAIDPDRDRLALATQLGATATWCPADGDIEPAAASLTGGFGCDSIVIAAATESSAPFETAAAIARDRAAVVLVGITGTEFPYRPFMQKELSIRVARSYGPGRYDPAYERQGMTYPEGYVRWTETENLRQVVAMIAAGRLDVARLTSHCFAFDDGPRAYAAIAEGREPYLGVVLRYDETRRVRPPAPVIRLAAPRVSVGPRQPVVGVIGAGQYARTVLLPKLADVAAKAGATLHTVSSARGLAAEDARRRFGFAFAASGEDAVLENPEIAAVLVLSPHASHPTFAARAMQVGKSVLVEKPLAIDLSGLAQVVAARDQSPAFFQVGFNRRFAPFVAVAKATLARLPGRKHVTIRANVGRPAADAWESEADHGGGRLLGEACHFVDLARHLVGSPIVAVQAAAAEPARGPAEDLALSLAFEDGSLASIAYTTLGDTGFSKELVEVFAGGQAIRIDNFRELTLVRNGRSRRHRAGQDKGHVASLLAFLQAVASGDPSPLPEAEAVNSTLATILAKQSLAEGRRIRLDEAVL